MMMPNDLSFSFLVLSVQCVSQLCGEGLAQDYVAPKIKCRSDPGPCFHPNLKTDPEVRSSKKLEAQH